MEINNGSSPMRGPHLPPGKSSSASGSQAESKTARSGNSLTSIDTGTTEGIKSLLSKSVEVRESLVEEIKLKIESGEYLTKRAVYETADAILNL